VEAAGLSASGGVGFNSRSYIFEFNNEMSSETVK
jgi:hypothetical protein